MSALLELAARCERATGPDRELDLAIAKAIGAAPQNARWLRGDCYSWDERGQNSYHSIAQYTASLDAAMSLVPEGWAVDRGTLFWPRQVAVVHLCETKLRGDGTRWTGRDCGHVRVATDGPDCSFALALCAAALRSRAAMSPDTERSQ